VPLLLAQILYKWLGAYSRKYGIWDTKLVARASFSFDHKQGEVTAQGAQLVENHKGHT